MTSLDPALPYRITHMQIGIEYVCAEPKIVVRVMMGLWVLTRVTGRALVGAFGP